jgi:hypothetical protein
MSVINHSTIEFRAMRSRDQLALNERLDRAA